MGDLFPLFISIVVIIAVVVLLSARFKLSNRYERKPRVLNSWSAQDHGIDPTDDEKL
jgi:hypothetical protein